VPLISKDIVDSGSNANGSYVRFSDGTQICWQSVTVTDQAIDTAYGSLYLGSRNFTFPAAFIAVPTVTCGSFYVSSQGSFPGSPKAISTTSVTIVGMDISSRAAGGSTLISYTAIGKWR
jgi:hypothetical protein